MGSSVQKVPVSFSPQTIEALAILCGIKFALSTDLMPFVIESDVLNVANFIRYGRPFDADANLIAHGLAKMALSIDEDKFWLECIPPCVEMLVMGDIPG
ncbi:hypothetical protein Ddye_011059 [Dipteronia dyeriana]|uniref:RNase H type-1 domain-containing protein n=1 Tax=Dipteronia dyeriana TaxID=168575 RepID=A0AAD9XEX2_9ROSI|nr:hypothetical protein Ddye_011059 [Dipteronia dyeriana]